MRMFNFIRQGFNVKGTMAFAMASVLFTLSHSCWAGECQMNNGKGGTTTLINSEYSGGTVRLPPPGNYASTLFNVNLTPGIQAKCGAGDDGFNLVSQTNPTLLMGSSYGRAMFETNIPGIYYSVRVHTAESDGGMGGYFAMNTTGWTTVASSGKSDPWDEKWINTSVQIYIDEGYRGNPNKETSIRPKPGTLGKMGIGNPNDSDNQPWTFVVNEDSFQIPIVLPTCDMAMLSDGTNNVNLGEYYVSDIKNNRVKDIPFSISLSNCTGVANITTKLTTSKLTGKNNDLLGNTLSSGAEGAGVRIMYNGTSQLLPNNPDSSYVITDYQTPESKQINYVAQLVANGNTVKPGSFKATGVFTLSYD